jgi:hypothetical protein
MWGAERCWAASAWLAEGRVAARQGLRQPRRAVTLRLSRGLHGNVAEGNKPPDALPQNEVMDFAELR